MHQRIRLILVDIIRASKLPDKEAARQAISDLVDQLAIAFKSEERAQYLISALAALKRVMDVLEGMKRV